jgi:hypothetical protein
MTIGAGADEAVARSVLPENHHEVYVVRHAESAHQSVVDVLVEAHVFVVGGDAVDVVLGDEDEGVDEGASAGEMVHLFVVLLIQNLDVLLAVGEQSQVGTVVQFEYLFSLQLHFIEPTGRQKLAFFLAAVILLPVDEVVGELLESDLLQAEWEERYWLRSMSRNSSTKVRIYLAYLFH